MYIHYIIAAIAASSLLNKPSEMRAFVVFSGMCTLMLFIGATIVSNGYGEYYHRHYLLCGLLHLLILIGLSKYQKMSDTVFCLYIINIAFIYLNLFGFLIDFAYIMYYISEQSRQILIMNYNTWCEVLYSLVLVSVFYRFLNGLWTTGIHRVISFFRSNMRRCIPQLCLSKKEERT